METITFENIVATRKSWDTSVKHLERKGVLRQILSKGEYDAIPSSNRSRWRNESEDKYTYCEINFIVAQEIEFIRRINSSTKIKEINEAYFKLADTFHNIISEIKGVKSLMNKHKTAIVDVVTELNPIISKEYALKIFNISRSCFENYKSIVIHQCEASYFNWCSKRFTNQLLTDEVEAIKSYMTDSRYMYWSKSSIYIKGARDGIFKFSLPTFYKYCRLLGFKGRPKKRRNDFYNPIKTSFPNELWCADITIYKTTDNVKHYIHLLIDHYSRKVLAYRIGKRASGFLVAEVLRSACLFYKPISVNLLTDGGVENVNQTVDDFVFKNSIPIRHLIAQKDVVFSNSMVESVNKVLKHQFIYPLNPENGKHLLKVLKEIVPTYNNVRPQLSIGGNTPDETMHGLGINPKRHLPNLREQLQYRREQNKQSNCAVCSC